MSEKCQGMMPIRRAMHRLESNIKMNLTETEYEDAK
jgi:hypothetical protein